MTGQTGDAGMGGLVRDGLRTLVFMAPKWRGGAAGPWQVLGLLAAAALVGAGLARLQIDGPAEHYPWAWASGWLPTLALVLVGWLLARHRPGDDPPAGPDAGTVFAWLVVVSIVTGALAGSAYALLARHGFPPAPALAARMHLIVLVVLLLWEAVAFIVLAVRLLPTVGRRAGVVAAGVAYVAASVWLPGASPWYPVRPDVEDGPATPQLTQEVFEAQSRELVAALDAVQPQRPGLTELYAITFAPYADEDVFSREVAMVGGVMRERFDAGGRAVNLQNHASTFSEVPWATPINLQRAIGRMAERMDRDEDVLFLHLTSHGARDGRLAARFFPLSVDDVTPQQLRQWLDDAGVRYAVVSISACYSGSWIAPLQSPGTLVMTAADATHTSYGCGRRSPLTFFGRAVYDEQLRETRSFEAAHAAALPVIDRREKEAGKTDGPSSPQIWVGPDIRPRLAALERRLGGEAPPAP